MQNGDLNGEVESPARKWNRAILHIDMDAFYVNVHLLDFPEDAGLPIVVGGRPDQRGVVSSASYQARRFGIRSAMSTRRAVRLCPNLKIVPANWKRIRECSRQVMSILSDFGPLEQISVDEAFLDLSQQADPPTTARHIRRVVKEQTGLPCSVGLSTSKLVAKVASDHEKPEGLTIVQPGDEASFLASMPPRVLWGVGPRSAERLEEKGIETCGQLAGADLKVLRPIFGRQAESLRKRARGIDERKVHTERGMAKSISQEWTFSRDVNDPEVLEKQLRKMAESVANSLQKKNLLAHTVRVKFRWSDFTTFTRQKSIAVGTDSAETIFQLARSIWERHWQKDKWVRLLGVGVSKLDESKGRQLDLGI